MRKKVNDQAETQYPEGKLKKPDGKGKGDALRAGFEASTQTRKSGTRAPSLPTHSTRPLFASDMVSDCSSHSKPVSNPSEPKGIRNKKKDIHRIG